MSKPTKENVHYRYPEECCGKCKAARQSDYGDYYCLKLIAGSTIDVGGLCDLYEEDGVIDYTNAEIPDPVGIERVEVKQPTNPVCGTCSHSYYDQVSLLPKCNIDDTVIAFTGTCGAWEE